MSFEELIQPPSQGARATRPVPILVLAALSSVFGALACHSPAQAELGPSSRRGNLADDGGLDEKTSCGATWVELAEGRVVTSAGDPLASAVVAVCVETQNGAACLAPVRTDAEGRFAARVPEGLRCVTHAAVSARVESDAPTSVTYCPLPLQEVKGGTLRWLYDLELGSLEAPLVPMDLARSDTRQVVRFPSNIELSFAPDDVIERDLLGRLGARFVDPTEPTCFGSQAERLDMLVAFGPDINVALFLGGKKIGFALPNLAAYPDGSLVDLLLLGGFATYLDEENQVEEGAFVPFGHGVVRNGVIVPEAGSELPALTMLGVRLAKL